MARVTRSSEVRRRFARLESERPLTHTCFFRLGFLAYLALGKSHEEAIQAGAYCAFECIQQSGCTFPERPSFDPATFVV